MDVRRATTADAKTIGGIHVRSWQHAYAGQLPQAALDSLSIEQRVTSWTGWLRHPQDDLRVWVAHEQDRPVGFASTGKSRDPRAGPTDAELYAIYLEPDAIGTGRGGHLFGHAIADLVDRGFERAELWVLVTNDRARGFYEHAGWRTDGVERTEVLFEVRCREVRYRTEFRP